MGPHGQLLLALQGKWCIKNGQLVQRAGKLTTLQPVQSARKCGIGGTSAKPCQAREKHSLQPAQSAGKHGANVGRVKPV